MLKRNSIPAGALFMILVLALASFGVGYGLWAKLLEIRGTVLTGTVDAIFDVAFTDDDGEVNNPLKDAGDVAPCPLFGDGACDPKAFGPNPLRYDKDVGDCKAWIDDKDPELLYVEVENGYPSYHCTVWYDILNNGTIPVMIQSLQLTPVNFVNGKEVTVALSELACGLQIDPTDPLDPDPEELVQGDIHIHVEQDAGMDKNYAFTAGLFLVQWNEFDEELCPQD
jgi:hypothetical protein